MSITGMWDLDADLIGLLSKHVELEGSAVCRVLLSADPMHHERLHGHSGDGAGDGQFEEAASRRG
ncbi:hypothetical protein I546_7278 [Mycobacterium kansasii 732]|nr:hypothetical protein I546_7278 [Mycobacterium kansasii 732]